MQHCYIRRKNTDVFRHNRYVLKWPLQYFT